MRRLSLIVLLGFFSVAPIAQAQDLRLMEIFSNWQQLRAPESPGIAFVDGSRFITQHPGWPDEKTIRLRTEAAALFEHPEAELMRDFCANYPPISGRGMYACLQANAGDDKLRNTWLHQGWVQGDFNESEERSILSAYGNKLTGADHSARVERLLYEGKVSPAKRMLNLVPLNKHALYLARMAIITDAPGAIAKYKALPAKDKNNAGILFDRINWRVNNHQEEKIAELFMAAPRSVPYPDLWWPNRAIAAREALATRDYGTALAVLGGHGNLKPEAMAEALWLKGWIILEFRNDPGTAYKEFFALYKQVGTPVSKARAAYWAGRAAIRNGNQEIARQWMEKAALHPTVFYGQLAHIWLRPDKPLKLPDAPNFLANEKESFEREELVGVTHLLAEQGDTSMLKLFLSHLATNATTPARAALVADLAKEVSTVSDRLRVAKAALRQGIVMMESGWPTIAVPSDIAIEPALALAITRQESEFDTLACSSANARGLMQLLPATARQVASKNGLSYSDRSLDDPQQNLTLGTTYLGQIISGFDGSYILGIASYNAGPGNVRKWIEARGMPPRNLNGAIDWIESIPFAETRNYVQRALENVQIYRTLADPETPPKLGADLVR